MTRLFLFTLFIFFITPIFGQTITISGKVLDEDGAPVPNTRFFFVGNTTNNGKTKRDGSYSIRYTIGQNDTLKFQHVGFDETSFFISKRMEKKAKGIEIVKNVMLPFKTTKVVVVNANKADTLFGTQDYSIADFEFDKSGAIIMLTYDKNLSKGSMLRLLDSTKTVTDRYFVQPTAVELRKDYLGNVHLITEEQVFLVQVKYNKLEVLLEDRDYFFKYVSPLIDTIGENIYYSNYSEVYPAFDYMQFNRKDSIFKTMLTVEDEFMMELYRSEYKYVDVRTKLWAHNKQIETGIDKEIWVGATVFTNSLYYEPLYAPLFKVGEDSLFVFDHYKNYLFKYVPEEGVVDSTKISYHKDAKKSGWEQPLIQDRENDQVYSLFLRNGYTYLSEIDRQTGTVKKSFRLHYKYIEKIKIIDGKVYYIYRPFESVQKKYIYREKLGGN